MRTLLVALLAGCWSASPPVEPPKGQPAPVDVAIASIRLADDCNGVVGTAEVSSGSVAGDCAGDCNFHRECEQTQLQVSLRSTAGMKTTVALKKIEMLDDSGAVIGTLESRAATRWKDDGSYTPWDQQVGPGEVMAASYALTAPNWGAIPGGRDPSKKVRVRVTFMIGGGDKTFEKEAVIAAYMDPNVVT